MYLFMPEPQTIRVYETSHRGNHRYLFILINVIIIKYSIDT